MPVTVKKVVLWRTEAANEPGVLARTLEPLANAGADLQIVMGYRFPEDKSKAAIEVYPVTGKAVKAAQSSGLAPSTAIAGLLVEGDNKPGLGYRIAKAVGDSRINMSFLVAQVVGKKYSALFGFESDEDSRKAASIIKKVTSSPAPRKK